METRNLSNQLCYNKDYALGYKQFVVALKIDSNNLYTFKEEYDSMTEALKQFIKEVEYILKEVEVHASKHGNYIPYTLVLYMDNIPWVSFSNDEDYMYGDHPKGYLRFYSTSINLGYDNTHNGRLGRLASESHYSSIYIEKLTNEYYFYNHRTNVSRCYRTLLTLVCDNVRIK